MRDSNPAHRRTAIARAVFARFLAGGRRTPAGRLPSRQWRYSDSSRRAIPCMGFDLLRPTAYSAASHATCVVEAAALAPRRVQICSSVCCCAGGHFALHACGRRLHSTCAIRLSRRNPAVQLYGFHFRWNDAAERFLRWGIVWAGSGSASNPIAAVARGKSRFALRLYVRGCLRASAP